MKQLSEQISRLESSNLSTQFSQALVYRRELQKIENLVSQIDLSDHQALEDKLIAFSEDAARCQNEQNRLREERGKLMTKIETLSKSFKKLSSEQEKTSSLVESCEADLNNLLQQWPDF